jgi:CheY-like chemotaxis protein
MTAAASLARRVPATEQVILLVEDNADDVLLIQRAFRKANLLAPLTVVGDGEAAIRYLAGDAEYQARAHFPLPSLVLLDLKLPRKNGLEVLQWARGQRALRGIPVVVLTSSQERHDVERAYDAGANSFLCKPVDFEQLIQMVHALDLYWLVMNTPPARP